MKEIENLVAVSQKYGSDPRFVIAGGGNTSYKNAEKLWVKASGFAMATITEDGFAVLDRSLLNPMGEKVYSSDTAEREEQVKNDLAAACITKNRRPSVETSLHNAMSAAYIVHTHPTLVNGVMCSANAEATCKEGGTIIICAECADGHGGEGFYSSLKDCESAAALYADQMATPQDKTVPDQWESQILARILMKFRVIFVTRPEMRELVENMKMLYAPSLDEAIAMARSFGGESVTVIPNGISVIVR